MLYLGRKHRLLENAEAEALKLTCERADLQNGHSILELGWLGIIACGWRSSIHKVRLLLRATQNTKVMLITKQKKNSKTFKSSLISMTFRQNCALIESFLEMFEHLRNHQKIFDHLNRWLKPDNGLYSCFCSQKRPIYLMLSTNAIGWLNIFLQVASCHPSNCFKVSTSFKEVVRWEVNGITTVRRLKLGSKTRSYGSIKASSKRLTARIAPYGYKGRIFYMACSNYLLIKTGRWLGMHYRFTKK